MFSGLGNDMVYKLKPRMLYISLMQIKFWHFLLVLMALETTQLEA